MKFIEPLSSILVFIMLFNPAQAQSSSKLLQKSWIKVNVENLSEKAVAPDTTYTRYTFSGNQVYISYDPGWDGNAMTWSANKDHIAIGFTTFSLQELTDSTLVFYQTGFRKFHLISEEKFIKQKSADTTTQFNGETVYLSNKYITPRFKNHKSFYEHIEGQVSSKFDINRKSNFIARFIVTNKGKVENVRVIQGIMDDYDYEAIMLINKTSGKWLPAQINNQPVNSEIQFEIKYLNSLTSPYRN